MNGRSRLWLGLVIAVCLGWAAAESRNLTPRQTGAIAAAPDREERARVEESFAPITEARAEGRVEEALLALTRRTAEGPYPGYAWFLLAEIAYVEGSQPAAVDRYRKALEVDPGVGDRTAAFDAGRTMASRLEALRALPALDSDSALRENVYYLVRRLAGGCE